MSVVADVHPEGLRRCWVRGIAWHHPEWLPVAELRAVTRAMLEPAHPSANVLGGRDSVFVHESGPLGRVVVKEYRRGGHLGAVIHRHHLRRGFTRAERKFRNLITVRGFGVRAPEPVAYASRGLLFYRSFLVTRYVSNQGSLAAFTCQPPDRLTGLVAGTAEQVALLMAHRMIHVDLHPGNVLVGLDNEPWLLDFDRASFFEDSFSELRRLYIERWQRAVAKHGLSPTLSEVFASELYRLTRLEVESTLAPAPVRG